MVPLNYATYGCSFFCCLHLLTKQYWSHMIWILCSSLLYIVFNAIEVAYSTYLNIHVSYYIKEGAVVIIDNWNAKKARKVSITCLLSQCCVINSVQVDEKIIPPPTKKKKIGCIDAHPKNVLWRDLDNNLEISFYDNRHVQLS